MLLIFGIALLIATTAAQDESSEYYGFPVGEISHDQSSTSGMLFLADPQTLIITNFSHLPHSDVGCFSIMLGPAPTPGDAMKGEKMTKDGILLKYSPLNALRRKKRSADLYESLEEVAVEAPREKRQQQARGRVVPPAPAAAPVDRVQMDSLIERAADEKAAGSGESSAREQEKEVTLHSTAPLVAFAVDMGRRGKTRRSSKRKEINGDVLSNEMIGNDESFEDLDSYEDFKQVLEDANNEKLIIGKHPAGSDSFEDVVEGERVERKEELKKVEPQEAEKEKADELSQMEQLMIQEAAIMANSTVDASSNSTTSGEEEGSIDVGTSIIKEHAKRAVEHSDIEGSGMDDTHNKKLPGRHDRLMKGNRNESSEDMGRGKKKGHHKHRGEEKEKMEERMDNRTHTASAREVGENDLNENGKEDNETNVGPFKPTEFSLPRLAGARASFSLREHGKLSDFHWIGIYDQCTKKAYQLHEIAGSEIPDLESIAALAGVAANVSSDSVQIVNCDTIVIQNFYFLKDTKRPNTFFHVGTGVYPLSVQSHQRVRVLGQQLDDILESVNGKDLVIKLPEGIRTFDVDFIMVFNEDSNRAYGHTFIPSLLVPPCDNL